MLKLTQSAFIQKAISIHGNKYDFSKSIYKTYKNKVVVGCSVHGDFQINAGNLLNGGGCGKCYGRQKNTKDIIKEFTIIHNNEYNYNNVHYINANTPVIITCKVHGEFLMTPKAHLRGAKCKKCNHNKLRIQRNLGIELFIKKANIKHKYIYDYSNVEYLNNETKVQIYCKMHGIFLQNPNSHLNGAGCPKCKSIKTSERCKLHLNTFIKMANKIHNYTYDYKKALYINYQTKLTITCPKHGDFLQQPSNHLMGKGCLKCRTIISKEHQKIIDLLTLHKIIFTINDRDIIKPLELDLFIPSKNIGIEIDGIYWHSKIDVLKRDERKNIVCQKKNINLIRLTDEQINNNYIYVEKKILQYIF